MIVADIAEGAEVIEDGDQIHVPVYDLNCGRAEIPGCHVDKTFRR